MPANIYDIARRAGVSITTVSHALSGRGRVAPQTRKRILRLAEETGYTANPHAQSLVSGRNWTIAIQIAGFTTTGNTGLLLPDAAYFMDVLNGASSAAAKAGYALILAPYDVSPAHVLRLGLDGLIVVDPAGDEPLATMLAERDLPVVTTGRPTRTAVQFAWVDNDHAAAAVRLLDRLMASGYHRPALVATNSSTSYVADIVDAYQRWASDHRLKPRIVEVPQPPTEAAGARAARRLLLDSDPPDAIYATYDRVALGILREANRLGVNVPDSLGVASAVDGDLLRVSNPPVTAVALNARRVGSKAVDVLRGLSEGNEPAQQGFVVPSRLVIRRSTMPAGVVEATAVSDDLPLPSPPPTAAHPQNHAGRAPRITESIEPAAGARTKASSAAQSGRTRPGGVRL